MKKILLGVLFVVIAVSLGFYYVTTKNIENKTNEFISNFNKENNGITISGKADVGLLSKTLVIKDVNIVSEGEVVTGNLAITGINYFDSEEIFSDKIKFSMNDVELKKAGKTYLLDNNISFNNHSDGKLDLDFESIAYEKSNKDIYFKQKISVVFGNTDNFYKELNQLASVRINKLDKDTNLLEKSIYNKFLNSHLVNANLLVDNNKLLQDSFKADLKLIQPNLSDEQISTLNKEIVRTQINSMPKEFQEKTFQFFEKDKSSFNLSIKQKNSITFKDLGSAIMFDYNNIESILNNYFVMDLVVK